MYLCVPAYPCAAMVPSTKTQELQCVLLVTQCNSCQRLWDIICDKLDMTWQLIAMVHDFLPPSQQPDMLHGATYHTLSLPAVLNWATDFEVADEDQATQDAMDAKVLWHHL
ncbi:hypothetical protein Y1Q_0015919 [Alligator mississippiensis]|uniref:Uncharacterized protein n=1 Tax=Alligator mississippiensis TaxID=8496 RepID=A0A151MV35_ALLMI|nr:hypothetical protein Y1Q_0015919 [Alligator mississippiensis]